MLCDQQFRLRWNNHRNTVLQEFEILLRNDKLVDCIIGAEGRYLKAHKVVLSACSPYLRDLLSEHFDKHPIILLKDVPFNDLKYMIDYMYCGEINITEMELTSFLKSAQSLKIKGLADDYAAAADTENKTSYTARQVPNEEFSTNAPIVQDIVEPPPKKPVPDAVLIPTENRPSYKRKQPNIPQRYTFNNVPTTNGETFFNATVDELEIEPETTIDETDDEDSEQSEIMEEEFPPLPPPPPPPPSKINSTVKEELIFEEKKELYNTQNNSETMYTNDTLPSTSTTFADQVLAGKNLNELTITSFTENEPCGTVMRDEDWNPYINVLSTRMIETLKNADMGTKRQMEEYNCLNQNNEYVCHNCGKTYNRKGNLGRHKRYECGKDKQFKCPVCPKSFFRKDKLTVHYRMSHHVW